MLMERVNHASYIVKCGNVRLIRDPWLERPAFNQGWGLLSPTKLRYDEFSSILDIPARLR